MLDKVQAIIEGNVIKDFATGLPLSTSLLHSFVKRVNSSSVEKPIGNSHCLSEARSLIANTCATIIHYRFEDLACNTK